MAATTGTTRSKRTQPAPQKQIVPTILFDELFQGGDSQTERVLRAVMTMKKLNIEDLKAAAEGK